jgi:hypothetical protein
MTPMALSAPQMTCMPLTWSLPGLALDGVLGQQVVEG